MAKNKTKKADRLGDLLANSLDISNKPAARKNVAPVPVAPQITTAQPQKDLPMPDKRTTVLFNEIDQTHLNKIIDVLYQAGERVTMATAIKIALELCPTSDAKLLKSLQNIKAADKRRKHK